MPNWFYYDSEGNKHGPITDRGLRLLITQKKIRPETRMETNTGHTGLAGQVPGLFPENQLEIMNSTPSNQPVNREIINATAYSQSMNNQRVEKKLYCTNCGSPVSEQSIACMSCGASPLKSHKFCRYCGTALNEEQIICVKCGAGIGGIPQETRETEPANNSGAPEAFTESGCFIKRVDVGKIAILYGALGLHKFILGSWGWGIVYILMNFFVVPLTHFPFIINFAVYKYVRGDYEPINQFTFFPIMCIMGLIEGIVYLNMSDKDFAKRYSTKTRNPFRW